MKKPAKRASPSRPAKNDRPETADLARGANGLGEEADPHELMQGMVSAQMQIMTTMMQASADVTAASFKAMTDFWSPGQTKSPERIKKKDRK